MESGDKLKSSFGTEYEILGGPFRDRHKGVWYVVRDNHLGTIDLKREGTVDSMKKV
jgi:hypothetical protein